jgi:FSR family fosmidomycin resistance protein-like MFS transporter
MTLPHLNTIAQPTSRSGLTILGFPMAVWVLAMAHGLVDCYATFIQPLWPSLAGYTNTDEDNIQWAFISWSLAGSITQLGFARLADMGRGRSLLWIGPIGGIMLIGLIGNISGLPILIAVLVTANLGFAAFHPEAATLAGSASPTDRAKAMSIFAVGGFMGQALGPSLSGYLVSHGGLGQLAWTILPGLIVCAALIMALKVADTFHHPSKASHHTQPRPAVVSIRQLLRGREWRVAHLVILSLLRVAAAMGVPLTLAYGLADKGITADIIGEIQSVFLIGMGTGTLMCAVMVNQKNENAVIWLAPLAVALILPSAVFLGTSSLWIVMAASGTLLGLSLPILTSRGQELMPDAPRVGSSLTMGVTWGFGAILNAALMATVGHLGNHFLAFYVLSAWLAISAIMSWPGWTTRWRKQIPS